MVPPELAEGLRWPLWYAPSTSNRRPKRSTLNWTEWWNNSGSIFPWWPSCWRTPRRTSWPSRPSQWPTGRSFGPTTRKETAEPGDPASQSLPWYGTWWAYPPTDSRRSVWWAWCWPSSMTSRPKPPISAPILAPIINVASRAGRQATPKNTNTTEAVAIPITLKTAARERPNPNRVTADIPD